MCKYFVLLSKNLSEYGIAMNTSYLQNSAAVMSQSLLQNLLSSSDFL